MNAVRFFILFLTMNLGGCSVLSPIQEHTVHHYTFSMVRPSQKTFFEKPTQQTISILPMRSHDFYDTTRMVYSTHPLQLNYFAYQYWVAPPAHLLTTQLTDYLRKHHFNIVESISSARVVKTELLECRQDFTQSPAKAVLGIRMQVEDASTHRLIFTKTIYATHPFYIHNAEHGVRALNRAKLKLFRRIEMVLNSASYSSSKGTSS